MLFIELAPSDTIGIRGSSLGDSGLFQNALDACLEDWLAHEAVHSALQSRHLLVLARVRSNAADEGLRHVRVCILCEVSPDFDRCFDA